MPSIASGLLRLTSSRAILTLGLPDEQVVSAIAEASLGGRGLARHHLHHHHLLLGIVVHIHHHHHVHHHLLLHVDLVRSELLFLDLSGHGSVLVFQLRGEGFRVDCHL